MSQSPAHVPFGSDLRAALVAMVKKRVPESEVEDIVQQALTEAIESPHAPKESEAFRRWIFGVAKHKVIDYHRRAGRETFDMPDVAGNAAPHVEADLLRWAERNIPEGTENQKTLDWMLREGEGEKLESIAASEKMPAPRVRQRVSRLRRHLKDNWQREVALLAALGVVIGVVVFLFVRSKDDPSINRDPNVADPRVFELRKNALDQCAKSQWKECVDGLDEAKRLDPAGDTAPAVQRAREDAKKALTPPPAPSSNLEPAPTTAPPEPTTMTPSPFASDSVIPSRAKGTPLAKPQPQSKVESVAKPADTPSPLSTTPPAPTPMPQSSGFPSKAASPPTKSGGPKKPAGPVGKGFGGSGSDSMGFDSK
ncbi:MAG: sigma-70 family RNA polymerase sigma factor [Deltaproteobacteria bacterium]|nr:sigma-70 family RNA polymerase sigma factor [Deltaproteobacteria bacterium]